MFAHALQRVGLLVIAFAFIAMYTSMLHGQRSVNDPDYESSEVTHSNVRQSYAPTQNSTTTSNDAYTGKANVGQFGGNNSKSNIGRRTNPSPLVDTKRLPPFPPSMGMNKSTSRNTGTNSNLPAFSQPNSRVTQASHLDTNRGIDRDGRDITLKNQNKQSQNAGPVIATPMVQNVAPNIQGMYVGANSREANVERIVRLENTKMDLERENEELRQLNSGLQSRVKETQDQLLTVAREFQTAKRELISAGNDLKRLRSDLLNLNEKIRVAQKEHSDVLKSMGPLLQQLLESDDVGSLPRNPTE
jgi:hypothetical protein